MNKVTIKTEGMNTEPNTENKRTTLKEFFSLGEVGRYFFRGKDDQRPTNINLRMMHGVNKISIVVFLVAIVYLVLRHVL